MSLFTTTSGWHQLCQQIRNPTCFSAINIIWQLDRRRQGWKSICNQRKDKMGFNIAQEISTFQIQRNYCCAYIKTEHIQATYLTRQRTSRIHKTERKRHGGRRTSNYSKKSS